MDRHLGLHFLLDANRINARQKLPAMNRIEAWADKGIIEVIMSRTSREEALRGGSRSRIRKVNSYIFSRDTFRTPSELEDERRIAQVLFTDGPETASERNDVRIVAHAKKYHSRLLTADGGSKRQPAGILGRREQLRKLGVLVMTDSEAVALVEDRIAARDKAAIQLAGVRNEPVPEWVGKD